MSDRLTIAQAARVLGMSERTLRRHVADGKIEAVKGTTPETGTAWFLDAATVEALAVSPVLPDPILAPKEEQEDVDVPTSYNADAMPEPLALLVERLDALLARSTLLEERVAGIERELEWWQRAQQARHLTVLRARWPFGKK